MLSGGAATSSQIKQVDGVAAIITWWRKYVRTATMTKLLPPARSVTLSNLKIHVTKKNVSW